MGVQVRYIPPRVNAIGVVHLAARAAEHAGAEILLEKSRPDVPVETARLAQSGRVTDTETGAAVGYGFDDGDGKNAPTANYAVKQHEDMDLNHPNGGGPKWLEKAKHGAHLEIHEAEAAVFRQALR